MCRGLPRDVPEYVGDGCWGLPKEIGGSVGGYPWGYQCRLGMGLGGTQGATSIGRRWVRDVGGAP